MARYKITRANLSIDMTAMCDVAFLLLAFFMLTSKPKSLFSEQVNLPFVKYFRISNPDDSFFYIAIKNGKCAFSVEGSDVRKEVLTRMGKKYNVVFTPTEVNKFADIPGFSCSIYKLKEYINNYKHTDLPGIKTGVPIDGTKNNELYNWIITSRRVMAEFKNSEARAVIYGDEKESYRDIKLLLDNMQRQQMNTFSLVTNMNVSANRFD